MSKREYNKLQQERIHSQIDSAQKFFELFIKGLLSSNNFSIELITAIPVNNKNHSRKFWNSYFDSISTEEKYRYLGFINLPIIKNLTWFIGSFYEIGKWVVKNRRNKEKLIVCDTGQTECCIAALLISKLLKTPIIGIVTDLPVLTAKIKKNSSSRMYRKIKQIYTRISEETMTHYDGYICLTEWIDKYINRKGKPSIIIECISDIQMEETNQKEYKKYNPKVIMYAGKLHEKFGVKNLVDSIEHIDKELNFELWFFGDGDSVELIKHASERDRRIKFKGLVSLDEIVKEEMKAYLLVNPRPTNDEFTKYSFPSKTIEYMASGTPVLTTKLKGIPGEYNKYLFFFENESPQGFAEEIEKLLKCNHDYMNEFGEKAKHFAVKKKGYNVQGKKIAGFMSEVLRRKM